MALYAHNCYAAHVVVKHDAAAVLAARVVVVLWPRCNANDVLNFACRGDRTGGVWPVSHLGVLVVPMVRWIRGLISLTLVVAAIANVPDFCGLTCTDEQRIIFFCLPLHFRQRSISGGIGVMGAFCLTWAALVDMANAGAELRDHR